MRVYTGGSYENAVAATTEGEGRLRCWEEEEEGLDWFSLSARFFRKSMTKLYCCRLDEERGRGGWIKTVTQQTCQMVQASFTSTVVVTDYIQVSLALL